MSIPVNDIRLKMSVNAAIALAEKKAPRSAMSGNVTFFAEAGEFFDELQEMQKSGVLSTNPLSWTSEIFKATEEGSVNFLKWLFLDFQLEVPGALVLMFRNAEHYQQHECAVFLKRVLQAQDLLGPRYTPALLAELLTSEVFDTKTKRRI